MFDQGGNKNDAAKKQQQGMTVSINGGDHDATSNIDLSATTPTPVTKNTTTMKTVDFASPIDDRGVDHGDDDDTPVRAPPSPDSTAVRLESLYDQNNKMMKGDVDQMQKVPVVMPTSDRDKHPEDIAGTTVEEDGSTDDDDEDDHHMDKAARVIIVDDTHVVDGDDDKVSIPVFTAKQLIKNILFGVILAIVVTFAIDAMSPYMVESPQEGSAAAATKATSSSPSFLSRTIDFTQQQIKASSETVRSVLTADSVPSAATATTQNDDVATAARSIVVEAGSNSNGNSNNGQKAMQKLGTLMRGPGKLALVMVYFGAAHLAVTGFAGAGFGMLLGSTLPPPPQPVQTFFGKAAGWVKKALKL